MLKNCSAFRSKEETHGRYQPVQAKLGVGVCSLRRIAPFFKHIQRDARECKKKKEKKKENKKKENKKKTTSILFSD